MGLSAARNTGLEQARGKWILFVDGDDCIHPQLLEYTLALAEQHNADLVSFDYERVAEDFCFCTDNAAQVADSRHKLTVEALYHRKKRGRWVIHGSACAQLYKRESSPRLYSFIYQAKRKNDSSYLKVKIYYTTVSTMANIALIIAGGVGSPMGFEPPKQFIKVYDKPVLLYTLENFQNHDMIDDIFCDCINGWEDELRRLVDFYGISKLRKIVPGGNTGQESIRNGIFAINEYANENDTIIIHDGIRPIVDDYVLTDVINVCHQKGNAVTSLPYNEQIFLVAPDDPDTTLKYIPRETLRRVSTPQAYKLHK